jgi:3,4-dihydroxy 2-butanone 4-phosphate synthase
MLDADSGRALTPADARAYARANDLVYVEGSDLIDALS